MSAAKIDVGTSVTEMLRGFNLTAMAPDFVARISEAGHAQALEVVHELLELEADARRERRIARLRKASNLPVAKTIDDFDLERIPAPLADRVRELMGGGFLEGATNILAFGLPGVGKSHAACAIGHALVDTGHSVLFRPAYRLVQDLLAAKRDLVLPKLLRRLDHFEMLIIDDIGYIKQNTDEAEVLFTLISERYERRSLLITSNLVFSDWERIFPSAIATVAAIDRLVHHSVILEFPGPSQRSDGGTKAHQDKPVGRRKQGASAPPKSGARA